MHSTNAPRMPGALLASNASVTTMPPGGRGFRSHSLGSRLRRIRSTGSFSPRRRRALSQAEKQDASNAEVRTWLLIVLHRRSHPQPERILDHLQWSGRDLHRATYLKLRHRLREEQDRRVIAHDIRDAAKESRHTKRSRKGKAYERQALHF
ncbi:hypothetical protein F4779DRAFT_612656 [Xylariaceae sp. FL0662B]|nr:hypothetical protein F4779DRAFT_612656 [Xylariaceae sp. FL0662B]